MLSSYSIALETDFSTFYPLSCPSNQYITMATTKSCNTSELEDEKFQQLISSHYISAFNSIKWSQYHLTCLKVNLLRFLVNFGHFRHFCHFSSLNNPKDPQIDEKLYKYVSSNYISASILIKGAQFFTTCLGFNSGQINSIFNEKISPQNLYSVFCGANFFKFINFNFFRYFLLIII